MFWDNMIDMVREFPPNTKFMCFLDANAQMRRHIPKPDGAVEISLTEKKLLQNMHAM